MKKDAFDALKTGDTLRHFLQYPHFYTVSRVTNGCVILSDGNQTATVTRHNFGQWEVVAKADVPAPA